MRLLKIISTVILLTISVGDAVARDEGLHLSIKEAMSSQKYKDALNQGVRFYFGSQSYPTPKSRTGEFVTNKKTNAFNKSDQEACEWVLLSALISLQDRALKEGGNAVVDIVSYYKKNTYKSNTKYECHAGNVIAGVALKGRVVKLP